MTASGLSRGFLHAPPQPWPGSKRPTVLRPAVTVWRCPCPPLPPVLPSAPAALCAALRALCGLSCCRPVHPSTVGASAVLCSLCAVLCCRGRALCRSCGARRSWASTTGTASEMVKPWAPLPPRATWRSCPRCLCPVRCSSEVDTRSCVQCQSRHYILWYMQEVDTIYRGVSVR